MRMDLLQKQIEEIYMNLGDRASKFIFQKRLMYSFTGDYSYILDIVRSLEEYEWLISNIESKIQYFHTERIWIFGAGIWGKTIYKLLSEKYRICGFVDNDESKYNSDEVKICSLEDAISQGDGIYIVAAKLYCEDMEKQLIDNHVYQEKIVSIGRIWRDYLKNRQYFERDIVSCEGNDEIFLDCGSYIGDTVDTFVMWNDGKYKKVYAFEPNEKIYFQCKEYLERRYRDITVIRGGVGAQYEEVGFEVLPRGGARVNILKSDCVIRIYSIDEILNGEKATFIKMDIEGSELAALKGAQATIKKYRPKLAICVYHKKEDIWGIASYILSLHKDYRLYFRHYSLGAGETVLYAV